MRAFRSCLLGVFCCALVSVAVAGLAARADSTNNNGAPGSAISPRIILPKRASGQVSVDTAVHALGTPVQITFVVKNNGSSPIHYTFPSAQQFDVTITSNADKRTVWQFSHNKLFNQMVTKLALDPGQSRTYTVTWPQVDNNGMRVPPGSYTITATLTPMSRLVYSGGLLIDPDNDPNNTGMPTKDRAETGATLQTNVTPPVSGSTIVNIEP